MRTVYLRACGDSGPNEWVPRESPAEAYHFMHVDDPIGQEPDGKLLQYGKNENGDEEEFSIQSIPFVSSVDTITIYGYGAHWSSTGVPQWRPNVRLYLNGEWTSQKTLNINYNTYSWQSVQWTELNASQDDLNNLLVDFIAPTGMGLLDYGRLESFYVQIDFERDVPNDFETAMGSVIGAMCWHEFGSVPPTTYGSERESQSQDVDGVLRVIASSNPVHLTASASLAYTELQGTIQGWGGTSTVREALLSDLESELNRMGVEIINSQTTYYKNKHGFEMEVKIIK